MNINEDGDDNDDDAMPCHDFCSVPMPGCAADTVSPRGWWKVARRLDYYRRLAALPGPRPAGHRPTHQLTDSPGRSADGRWMELSGEEPTGLELMQCYLTPLPGTRTFKT